MSKHILIVQLADIGDLVLSTPALSALRAAQPEAHIALLTSSHAAPILNQTGLVDEVIAFDKKQFNGTKALLNPRNLRRLLALRKGHYDTIVFFHHFTLKAGTLKFALMAWCSGAKQRIGLQNGNGWFLTESIPDEGFGVKHQAQYWLDLVGLLDADTVFRPAEIAASPTELLHHPESNPGRFRVAIHAGSGGYSLARRWDTSNFAVVADALHDQFGAQIVLVGGPSDDSAAVMAAMKTEALDLTGKTTLAELAGVIKQCDLFIGADSGVMHIAAAVGTPVIAIFGPSNHEAWQPWMMPGQSIVLRSAPLCSPCSYVSHTIGARDGCPARTCMRMVTAQHVVEAAGPLLSDNSTGTLQPSPEKAAPNPERVYVLGIPADRITYDHWLDRIGQWITSVNRAHQVCTVNPEFIMIARRDTIFLSILRRADICIADGIGVLWAARRLGKPLPERVTGSDGVPKIAECAAKEGWRLFLLGAAPGVADKAANVLKMRYHGLQIVGTYSGSPAPEEEDSLVQMVNASETDILFVAYGAPEQDKWIARNLPRLQVKMSMGVGGTFDFIAGIVPRAPDWMRRMGLEWLYRLYLQPWRIKRMMRLPRFVLAVLLNGSWSAE